MRRGRPYATDDSDDGRGAKRGGDRVRDRQQGTAAQQGHPGNGERGAKQETPVQGKGGSE